MLSQLLFSSPTRFVTRRRTARWLIAVLGIGTLTCRRDQGQSHATPSAPPPPAAELRDGSSSSAEEETSTEPPQGPLLTGGTNPELEALSAADSDRWVREAFTLQTAFSRVLVVGAPETVESVSVRRLNLTGSRAASSVDELRIDERASTLQEAATRARGGDLVAVWPGTYAGFKLENPPETGPQKFMRWTALGSPGQVKIVQAGSEAPSWMVELSDARYVIIDGFEIAGQSRPGHAKSTAARAGILIDGAFSKSGRLAHHIAVVGCNIRGHKKWGLHSTDSHSVLIQDNYFGSSAEEHGCYVSDGSDKYVIRRNVFANNRISGLQCNLDPDSALEELNEHPKMRLKHESTRAWAQKALHRAEQLFGKDQFPDGKGSHFIIEQNVAHGNGAEGGAAFNLAALSHSMIRNNLLYANAAGGIAQWDNDNSFDYDYHDPGPRSVAEVKGPESLPIFGCQQNVISNNTVLMSVRGRVAVQSVHGSWGTRLYNNVLGNEQGDAIEIDGTSVYRFEAGPNLYTSLELSAGANALRTLAKQLPSATDKVSWSQLSSELARPGLTAWRDQSGWNEAPTRPDFRPRPGASLLLGKAIASHQAAHDLLGHPRKSAGLGALEP